MWEKRWFRSFSAHPASAVVTRCPCHPIAPSAAAPADLYSLRRGDLCAPNRHDDSITYLRCVFIYVGLFIFFFFTAHVRLMHTSGVLCLVVNNGNGPARPVPDTPLAVPILSFLFIYFIPYESLWPGELRRSTVVFMCVCACICDPKHYDETKLVLL